MCSSSGHSVIYAGGGSTGDKMPPEGALCQCGAMKVVWQVCRECGKEGWKLVPIDERRQGNGQ